jgi:hypothetical protein
MQKFVALIFSTLFSLISAAQAPSIDIGGSISSEQNKRLQGALINVIRDGKPFTSFLTSFEGTYFIYLPIGAEYIVDVSKKGYVHKRFSVNTKNIPKGRTLEKFPLIISDLELLDHHEGVDYSLFNQPINKYYYDQKKENFDYDRDYLKNMLALIEEVKLANKNALLLAKNKEEKAIQDELMKLQRESEAMIMAKLDEELAAAKKLSAKKMEDAVGLLNEVTIARPPAVDALRTHSNKSERVKALLAKYKPGVTEEVIEGKNVVIVQRVIVKDDMVWVYHKKIFNWGVAFFRDGEPITESIFELETRKT